MPFTRWLFAAVAAVALGGAGLALRSGGQTGPSNFILVLDPGHLPTRYGATSAHGVPERTYNQRLVSFLTESLLQEPDLRVLTTNAWGDSVDNVQRADFANRLPADFFLSIHYDSADIELFDYWWYNGKPQFYCDRFSGFSIIISDKPETFANSERFARLLSRELIAQGFQPSRRQFPSGRDPRRRVLDLEAGIYVFKYLAVLHESAMPSALLECGVIANRAEEMLLNRPESQYRMVYAARQALRGYREGRDPAPDHIPSAPPGAEPAAATNPVRPGPASRRRR